MNALPTTRAALGLTAQNVGAPWTGPDREASARSAIAPYRRVLIVEDEATLRRVIARNLTGRGLAVSEADCAEAAVGVVERDDPDLILLDINLPDRTGWDVLRELRRRQIEVPTIVISAVGANPSRMAEFQPLAYLPKPFPIEALLRLVFPANRVAGELARDADS